MENLIDVNEAAEILHVTTETVYRHCRAKKLPHVRVGSRLLFKASALEAWIDGQSTMCPPLAERKETR